MNFTFQLKNKNADVRPFATKIHDRLKNQRNPQKTLNTFFSSFLNFTKKCDRREKQHKSVLANEIVDNADVFFFVCSSK